MQVTDLCRRLTIVAVPGHVTAGCNGSEVVAALGGNDAVAQLNNTQDIALSMGVHPSRCFVSATHNPNGKPCGLLVKLKKWSNGEQTTEIMGKVSSIFTFNQPADFLHIANLPVVTDEEGASNVLNQGYELLPPFFTKTAYIANIFKDTLKNSSSSKKGLKERTSHMLNPVAHFDDAEIPTKPLESTLHASLDRDLIMELKKLFTKRKVWLRTAMDEYLATRFSSWKKKNAFARICYIFADGPWRGCMCKLGYDPRKDPDSKIYQIIDFRDPYYRTISWRTEKQTNGREGSGAQSMPMPLDEIYAEAVKSMANFNPEVHFLAPPSRPSQLYQLCDIFDAGIQKLINNTSIEMEVNTTDTCSKATGWYTQAVMSKIRDMMNVKSLRMRQMQTASSLVQ